MTKGLIDNILVKTDNLFERIFHRQEEREPQDTADSRREPGRAGASVQFYNRREETVYPGRDLHPGTARAGLPAGRHSTGEGHRIREPEFTSL